MMAFGGSEFGIIRLAGAVWVGMEHERCRYHPDIGNQLLSAPSCHTVSPQAAWPLHPSAFGAL